MDQQGWHLWNGECPNLLGPHGSLVTSLGVSHLSPLSWKKTAIGSSNTWLRFMVTPSQQLVRMAPTKHDLVMSVLSRMMANDEFTRPELDSALGRLQWATTCCPLTKPFLQAFWQWRIAVKSSGRPSKLLRGFAKLLYNLFDKDFRHPSSFAPQSPWWGASDASASDDGSAFVGGWLSDLPTPSKHQVGPSRTRSPKGGLQHWRCLAPCSSPCFFVDAAQHPMAMYNFPWQVTTREMCMACLVSTPRRCQRQAC